MEGTLNAIYSHQPCITEIGIQREKKWLPKSHSSPCISHLLFIRVRIKAGMRGVIYCDLKL